MYLFKTHEKAMLTCFEKAFAEGEHVIPTDTLQNAQSLRARVYTFVRGMRTSTKHEKTFGPYLEKIDGVSLHAQENLEGGYELLFRRKDHDPAMQALMSSVGQKVGEVFAPAEDQPEMQALLEKLQKVQEETDRKATEGDAYTRHYLNKEKPQENLPPKAISLPKVEGMELKTGETASYVSSEDAKPLGNWKEGDKLPSGWVQTPGFPPRRAGLPFGGAEAIAVMKMQEERKRGQNQ